MTQKILWQAFVHEEVDAYNGFTHNFISDLLVWDDKVFDELIAWVRKYTNGHIGFQAHYRPHQTFHSIAVLLKNAADAEKFKLRWMSEQ